MRKAGTVSDIPDLQDRPASRTFLYVWELGANFGHVGAFAAYAAALTAQGHVVDFAVRETTACARLLPSTARWFQAPRVDDAPAAGPPLNYADILLKYGYDDPVVLRGLLVGWREILLATQPDLIIADHAPTAMLAARLLGLPVMLFCTGFMAPPRQDPFPAMRPWHTPPRSVLAQRDAAALASVNAALAALQGRPLARLSDLFDVAEPALMGVPELDHYPARGAARYWGPSGAYAGTHIAPGWPDDGRRRVFGYLRPDHPQLPALLQALSARDEQALLCIPGWAGQWPLGPRVRVVGELVDLDAVAATAALAISYGHGTLTHLLAAGVPVLCLPTHLESYLLCMRIAALGAGAAVNPEAELVDFDGLIEQLLSPQVKAAASAFSARYAGLGPATVMRNFTRRAIALATAH